MMLTAGRVLAGEWPRSSRAAGCLLSLMYLCVPWAFLEHKCISEIRRRRFALSHRDCKVCKARLLSMSDRGAGDVEGCVRDMQAAIARLEKALRLATPRSLVFTTVCARHPFESQGVFVDALARLWCVAGPQGSGRCGGLYRLDGPRRRGPSTEAASGTAAARAPWTRNPERGHEHRRRKNSHTLS